MKVKVSNSKPSSFGRKLILFIRYNASQIKQGGWPVLWLKVKMFLLLLLSIPVVLVIRALRPLVLVRFSTFDSGTIGMFAIATEMYLCRRDAGLENKRTFDIFYNRGEIPNQQLKKMWGRRLHVSRFADPVDTLNRLLPGGERHVMAWPEFNDADPHGLLASTPAHLSFMPEEEHLGREGLQAMGIPEGAPFVCFHARDSEYKDVLHPFGPVIAYERGWSYLYPDTDHHYGSHRNSDIRNHIPAAEEMARRGYYAIRMGAIVKEPLQTTNPMIIDYATKHRSDFMDIYLCAKCYFYIGDEDGLNWVPAIFRRPIATVNDIPISVIHTHGLNDVSIFKKLWLPAEGRFLTVSDIFNNEFDLFNRAEQYEQAGVEPVENTAEEITALAVEMDERLKGTWQTSEEDEELQRRFWSLFKLSANNLHKYLHGLLPRIIGTDFLRRNRELLD